jgi:hypothetical protein
VELHIRPIADGKSTKRAPKIHAGRLGCYTARDQDPQMAGWLLCQIRHLYRIERELRKSRSGPQLRAAVRTHQAKPIYVRLHRTSPLKPHFFHFEDTPS